MCVQLNFEQHYGLLSWLASGPPRQVFVRLTVATAHVKHLNSVSPTLSRVPGGRLLSQTSIVYLHM